MDFFGLGWPGFIVTMLVIAVGGIAFVLAWCQERRDYAKRVKEGRAMRDSEKREWYNRLERKECGE